MIRFAVVVAVSVLLVAPSAAGAQTLGQLFIEVVDGAGQFVPGLTPADFVVREDGREAGIVSAEPVAPMKIAFMVDNGDRMVEMNALNALRNGMQGFLDAVPPPHEISLFTIGRNIQRRVDFTTDRGELQRSAGEIFLDRGASAVVLDGIRETWERRFEDDEPFPVFVMVLTDGTEGSGNYNENEYVELVNELITNAITVHVVLLSSPRRQRHQPVRAQPDPEHRRHLREHRGGDRHRADAGEHRRAHERPLRERVAALPGGLRAPESARRPDLGLHHAVRRPHRGAVRRAPHAVAAALLVRPRPGVARVAPGPCRAAPESTAASAESLDHAFRISRRRVGPGCPAVSGGGGSRSGRCSSR